MVRNTDRSNVIYSLKNSLHFDTTFIKSHIKLHTLTRKYNDKSISLAI